MVKQTIRMDMNRVEGDLQIEIAVDGNTVTDAWCTGTMYRGFEQILVGRHPNDALVITPRICGICSTSQLYAATSALEMAGQISIAPNGTRIRNLCLMAEAVMSDARHTFLMFTPDFCNPAYHDHALRNAVHDAFEPPFRGHFAQQAVEYSKRILGIVISFGGQWPHSTYMVPGGVTCSFDARTCAHCTEIVDAYVAWYESTVLGCSSERWLAIQSADNFEAWLDEAPTHQASGVGLFTRFGRSIGLHETGKGTQNLLSAGCYHDPDLWQPPFDNPHCLFPGGFYNSATGQIERFDHECIAEHVRHSWFEDHGGGRHPWQTHTTPAYTSDDDDRYSFAKAPRYNDQVAQLGPLADFVLGGDPLITSLFEREGANTWLRQFVRLHRPVVLLDHMRRTIAKLERHIGDSTFIKADLPTEGRGVGLINAARGTLGHWVTLEAGKIAGYQIVTPTTWNGSPRDAAGRRGHWEESFIGLEVKDIDNPIELCHVVRSHDACLVCTVHFTGTHQRQRAARW